MEYRRGRITCSYGWQRLLSLPPRPTRLPLRRNRPNDESSTPRGRRCSCNLWFGSPRQVSRTAGAQLALANLTFPFLVSEVGGVNHRSTDARCSQDRTLGILGHGRILPTVAQHLKRRI